mgnify:CR=1 FL=1
MNWVKTKEKIALKLLKPEVSSDEEAIERVGDLRQQEFGSVLLRSLLLGQDEHDHRPG